MPQFLTLNGKKYRYLRSNIQDYGSIIEPTKKKAGKIAIRRGLKGKIELDTNIHEMIHACATFGDEEWVNKTATEIAQVLWELGYRKYEQKDTNKKYKKRRKQRRL